jgi:capsular polysaccharide export protein
MLSSGLEQFKGKRVLLLQGPVGPFFARLSEDLRQVGALVFKVNFNAGDWFYYRRGAFNYRGTMEDWPKWLDDLIRRLNIDVVHLFGDCRPIHIAASFILSQNKIESWVFEEGYVRPDYVTLERFGVNGHSRRSRDPDHYLDEPATPKKRDAGNTYWAMVRCGVGYFMMGSLGKLWFRHYRHHRPLNLLEALPWVRSVWRKQWYRWVEREAQGQLTGPGRHPFFLVPLQVHNDAQITNHSDFQAVEHFIEDTMQSFAQHAPADALLVFKHHPMDRGHRDYAALIKSLTQQLGTGLRVRYIHDQHLPTLLDHACGVVVVNSTVGLSALHHGASIKVCGNALYDIPGLCYQGPLDQFWRAAPNAKPNPSLYKRFRKHLISKTQLNGSFYKPLSLPGSCAGLIWGVAAESAEYQAGDSATIS